MAEAKEEIVTEMGSETVVRVERRSDRTARVDEQKAAEQGQGPSEELELYFVTDHGIEGKSKKSNTKLVHLPRPANSAMHCCAGVSLFIDNVNIPWNVN
jgi:hypothetical protein